MITLITFFPSLLFIVTIFEQSLLDYVEAEDSENFYIKSCAKHYKYQWAQQ